MSHVQSTLIDGDGREKVSPYTVLLGTMPMAISRAQCRRAIQSFEEKGVSYHSAGAGTLWVLLEHCQSQGAPYVLTARPGKGYEIRKEIK